MTAHREQFRRYLSESPILPAPMCGFTQRPFRDLMRGLGAHMVYTPMYSSEAVVRGDPKTWRMMDFRDEASPVVVQVFGSRPAILAEASKILVRHGADVIDLNLGCPARKIVQTDCGSALLDKPKKLQEILRSMRRALDLPFTVKVRWHPEDGRSREIARMVEGEGLDGIAVHARTRAERFGGSAHWDCIARLREWVTMPVIGNGDIKTEADAERMRQETGCDGVMAGRGIITNPWLVRDARRCFDGESLAEINQSQPDASERLSLMFKHARLMRKYRGSHGLIEFRKFCVGYIHGMPGARAARTRLMQVTEIDELREVLHTQFPDLTWDEDLV